MSRSVAQLLDRITRNGTRIVLHGDTLAVETRPGSPEPPVEDLQALQAAAVEARRLAACYPGSGDSAERYDHRKRAWDAAYRDPAWRRAPVGQQDPPLPCVVCGQGASWLDPRGRPRHPWCPRVEDAP